MFINLGAAGAVCDRTFTQMSGNYKRKYCKICYTNLTERFQGNLFNFSWIKL